jgi:hypothetical protein
VQGVPGWITLLPAIPLILVNLAGLTVSTILVVRHRTTPAILALLGFALLLLLSLANLGRGPLTTLLVREAGVRNFLVANTSIGCCCSAIDAVAIALLVVAIYRAVAGTHAAQPSEADDGPAEASPEEAM